MSLPVVCPITTKLKPDTEIVRVPFKKGVANVQQDCDIVIDQLRAIDNRRLIKRIGELPEDLIVKVKDNDRIVLDLE